MVMQNHSCDVHVASRVPFPGCALPRPFVNDRKCDCPDTCADEDRLTLTSLPGLKMWNKKEISFESFESFAQFEEKETNETSLDVWADGRNVLVMSVCLKVQGSKMMHFSEKYHPSETS